MKNVLVGGGIARCVEMKSKTKNQPTKKRKEIKTSFGSIDPSIPLQPVDESRFMPGGQISGKPDERTTGQST
jgi:hypothetical protein